MGPGPGSDLDPADLFTDAGLSGGRADNRPGLQAALDRVCCTGDERRVLVVYSLSRLARSTKDAISIGERLRKAGADLVSLTEQIDTSSAAGRMIFRLLAVLAEFERDLVSERTRAGHAHKRARGECIGQIPFGYRLGDDGARLVECETERATLARILAARFTERKSFGRIAWELTAAGVPTKNSLKKRRGRAADAVPFWRKSSVKKLCDRFQGLCDAIEPTAGAGSPPAAEQAHDQLPAPGAGGSEGPCPVRAGEAGGG